MPWKMLMSGWCSEKKMKIETYFLSDKLETDVGVWPIVIFDVLYQTIIPVLGIWLLFQTKLLIFWMFLLIPVFFRIKIRRKRIKKPQYKKK